MILMVLDECIYWYTYEELGKWFLVKLGNRFHVNFLVYSHFLMSIRISQMKDYSISVDQDRYVTSGVSKYIDTSTIKENSELHKTILHHDMIFTKEDAYTSYDKVEALSRE